MEVGRGGESWQGFRALLFVSSPVPVSVPCVGFGPMLHLCFQPGLWLRLLLLLIGLWLDPGPGSSLATSRVVDGPCHPAPSLPATFRHCGTAPRCWVTLAGSPQPGPSKYLHGWKLHNLLANLFQYSATATLTIFFLISTQYFSCCNL